MIWRTLVRDIPPHWLPSWLESVCVEAGKSTRIPIDVQVDMYLRPQAAVSLMVVAQNETTVQQTYEAIGVRLMWSLEGMSGGCAREHWIIRSVSTQEGTAIAEHVKRWEAFLSE